VNKLCLGTVQFGLRYGINNQTGRPTREQVFAMLDLAVSQGILCFDTAAATVTRNRSWDSILKVDACRTE
jgi:aryl-alcohol dehydrogenase-like predicted oxidoreductase